jgi:glycosyltransferase involved in cell wall biosynthesis
MNILAVSQAYAQFDLQGRAVHVRPLAHELARRGHRMTVLTTETRRRREPPVPPDEAIEVVALPSVARYRDLTVNPSAVPFYARRLRAFHVVHIFGLYDLLGPGSAIYCRRWRIPYVLEPMGMHPPRVSSIKQKRVFHWLFGRRMLSAAARVVATSELERTQLLQAGVDPVRVVLRRNGIETNLLRAAPSREFRARWQIPPWVPLIVFLGRLAAVKGLELLIAALAALPRPDAHLVLAGPEDRRGYRRRLEAVAAASGVSARVLFTGALYDEEKAAALRAADVFVLPSLSENFGVAAAEAMACGTPVVVTDRCGIADLVAGQGGLVASADADALRDAITRALTDAELTARFRQQGPAIATALSWHGPAQQMEALYEEIVAGP